MKRLPTIEAKLYEIGTEIMANSTLGCGPIGQYRRVEMSIKKLNKCLIDLNKIIQKRDGKTRPV